MSHSDSTELKIKFANSLDVECLLIRRVIVKSKKKGKGIPVTGRGGP
jgi:hypothetical protein